MAREIFRAAVRLGLDDANDARVPGMTARERRKRIVALVVRRADDEVRPDQRLGEDEGIARIEVAREPCLRTDIDVGPRLS